MRTDMAFAKGDLQYMVMGTPGMVMEDGRCVFLLHKVIGNLAFDPEQLDLYGKPEEADTVEI